MDFNGRVIMSLDTYDNLQMELIEAQDEVKRLSHTLDNIKVFELKDSFKGGSKDLYFTDYALKQYAELADQNPHLKFSELKKRAEWDVAESRAVGEDA